MVSKNELVEELKQYRQKEEFFSAASGLNVPQKEAEILWKNLNKDLIDKKRKRLNEKQEGFYDQFQQFTGIRLTFANILRQSQILNRFVGSTFQLLGGIIDIMLIALAPLITGILQGITRLFPAAIAFGRILGRVYTGIENTVSAIRDAFPEPIRKILSSENAILAGSITAVGILLFRPLRSVLGALLRLINLTGTVSGQIARGNIQRGFLSRNSLRVGRGIGFLTTAVAGLTAASSLTGGGSAEGGLLGLGLSTAGLFALSIGGVPGIATGVALAALGIAAPLIANAISKSNESRGDTSVTLYPTSDPTAAELKGRARSNNLGRDSLVASPIGNLLG